MENFEKMNLNDVALLAADGNVPAIEYIVNSLKGFVKMKAKAYYIYGAESEDLVQEGMIGLIKALRDYDPDKEASFRTFAELCVTRQILTAVKAACAKKNFPLNTYVSLYKEIGDQDGSEHYLVDELKVDDNNDPIDHIIRQEEFDEKSKKLSGRLSKFEMQVLSKYMEGLDYKEIAEALGKPAKSVDNALQRIKQKAEKTVKENIGDQI